MAIFDWQSAVLPGSVLKSKMWRSPTPSSAIVLLLIVGVLLQMTAVTEAISCVMCDSTVDGESCLNHPPRGTDCSFDSCITVLEYRKGKFYSAKMSCSPVPLEATCIEGKDSVSHDPVELCYWTCDYHECNRPKHRSLHHILELLSKKKR